MRIRRLVIAACLVGSSLALAAPAQAAKPDPTVDALSTTSVAYGYCQDATVQNLHAGEFVDTSSWSGHTVKGVRAFLTLGSPFQPCLDSNGLDIYGANSAVWIGLQSNTAGNGYAIIQLGMYACSASCGSSALDDGYVHYFWARAGCPLLSRPYIITLAGPNDPISNGGRHGFRIENLNGTYYLSIDGYVVWTIAANNDMIGCWANGSRVDLAWDTERWDHGDMLGYGSYPTEFESMTFKEDGLWANWYPYPSCSNVDLPARCSTFSGYTTMFVRTEF